MIYFRYYVIPRYIKEQGGDENRRISEVNWRVESLNKESNEGYKRVWNFFNQMKPSYMTSGLVGLRKCRRPMQRDYIIVGLLRQLTRDFS